MLLDTNALSAWAKGDTALWQALRPDRTWSLPSIVLGEYRYGLLKSTRRVKLENWLQSVETACVVLVTDAETARYYATLRRSLDTGRTEQPKVPDRLLAMPSSNEGRANGLPFIHSLTCIRTSGTFRA